jgi:hypothetical protein
MQPVPEGDQDHGGVAVPVPVCQAALTRVSTSAAVRCSRVQSSALGRLVGTTVRFTSVGGTSFRYDFAMKSGPLGTVTVRIFTHLRTAAGPDDHGESNGRTLRRSRGRVARSRFAFDGYGAGCASFWSERLVAPHAAGTTPVRPNRPPHFRASRPSQSTAVGLFHSSSLFGTLAARDHALFKIGIASLLR